MKTLTLLVVLAAITLAGCATGTPNIGPNPGRGSASGKAAGGDAESSASGLDFTVAFAQPGSTAVSSPVRNEDRTSNSQAGDAPQLVLGSASKDTVKLLIDQPDPIAGIFTQQIDAAMATRAALPAGDPGIPAADARLDALRADFSAHLVARTKAIMSNGGGLNSVQWLSVVFQLIKVNGATPEHLDAATVEAAGKGLVASLKAADNATK